MRLAATLDISHKKLSQESMRNRCLACFAVSLVLLPHIGCRRGSPDNASILVFAAASATNALDEIKAQFTAETGIEVRTSYAASSPLAQQIVHGADADLMLSADQKWIDFLAHEQYVAKRKDLLGNRLVIVVPADSKAAIARPDDLLGESIKHVAIGEPKSVPAGKYAMEALTRLGLWKKLEAKCVPADDVRHALMYVEMGAAEAGIVYATDAARSTRVKIAMGFPPELTGPIVYPVALLRHGANRKPAEAFYQYLSSSQAGDVFKKYGFVVLPASP
jgi:molybdate transport system substrate-binding protein